LFKNFGCWTIPSLWTLIVSEISAEVPQQLETDSIVPSPKATRRKKTPMPLDATECRCLLGPCGHVAPALIAFTFCGQPLYLEVLAAPTSFWILFGLCSSNGTVNAACKRNICRDRER
jgi:hypothetical protein